MCYKRSTSHSPRKLPPGPQPRRPPEEGCLAVRTRAGRRRNCNCLPRQRRRWLRNTAGPRPTLCRCSCVRQIRGRILASCQQYWRKYLWRDKPGSWPDRTGRRMQTNPKWHSSCWMKPVSKPGEPVASHPRQPVQHSSGPAGRRPDPERGR